MIEDGSVTVGHWIRLLYERIISDLENKVYFFDQKKANKASRFFVKLVLGKAEEPETKLPTSTGSWKKQESSRKTSISALLTMPEPLTVWITINCGKF